ncbi:MAG: 3-phosphoshikimate 1-carboxyvinyltransferase [Gammaproteobacteria bacterium]|nr:3-phosphoshikimate 1-carboxyvinyltransferase [Gammaproteobacteria bacterium]
MTTKEHIFDITPGGRLSGEIRVPGDKSISHRSIMFGSLAEGVTEVEGFLEGEDSLATLAAFRRMGVAIDGPAQGRVTIRGAGMRGLSAPDGPLDLGNSGTSMRLMAGLLSAQSFDTELTGDASLSRRPMRRVTQPLASMGARIETEAAGTPPLRIRGGSPLRGIRYDMPVASAQVKSALLLAGLYADGETCVTEPAPTRDHTERMLTAFGYLVTRHHNTVCVKGGGRLNPTRIAIPADISSAAFFLVGAAIAPGSDATLTDVGINPTRIGVINILQQMGARIDILNKRMFGGEPVADLRVRAGMLKGIDIPIEQVPLAIDEFPALFIAAACAEGRTVLTGAEELRVKESDRIQVMADGLRRLGVMAEPTPDGIVIEGKGVAGAKGTDLKSVPNGATSVPEHQAVFSGGEVESHGDHRIAMAFAVAGFRAAGPIRIRDCKNVDTSFPGFVGLARKSGLKIKTQDLGLGTE